ncbi:unnamed protein product, partial [Brassica rapa subsp. trilocularis]
MSVASNRARKLRSRGPGDRGAVTEIAEQLHTEITKSTHYKGRRRDMKKGTETKKVTTSIKVDPEKSE